MTELRELARFITNLEAEQIPQQVRKAAGLCVLDTIGAAIGAAQHPQVKSVCEAWLKKGGVADTMVDVWGSEKSAPLSTAAFLNALMGHTLEMDDVHTASKTHIGTVVVPAAWAMAQYLKKTGEELICAIVSGYEAMARIGMAFGVSSHRNRGWHVTGTAGTFGAAAACGKLLGLTEDEMVFALGMAGTQSFGLWAFLGDSASCKVLHTARAAQSGLEAALLAKAGMTGPEHILTAKDGGLLAAMSDEHDVSRVSASLGERWEILYMDNKPYPCCRSTHCTIDAALSLRNEEGVRAEDVESVVVYTYLVGNKQCGMSEGSRNPVTPVDAKFSTPYTVACALLYGEVTLRQFEPEAIADRQAQALLRRVRVETDKAFTAQYPAHWGCRLEVALKDGRTLQKTVKDASGSVANPLSEEQVLQKAGGLIRETQREAADGIARAILATAEAPTLAHL